MRKDLKKKEEKNLKRKEKLRKEKEKKEHLHSPESKKREHNWGNWLIFIMFAVIVGVVIILNVF